MRLRLLTAILLPFRVGSGYRGKLVLGTGIDEDVFKKAGIERADAFIAVTNGDNTNAMAGQIASSSLMCRMLWRGL